MKSFKISAFVIGLFFIISLGSTLDFLTEAQVDLNGDGKSEKISISEITELGGFVLKVDKISVRGKTSAEDEKVDGFIIVDIDTTDRYKEIAVHTPGPSDDDEYLIFWYDGKLIREMGRLSRWPDFPGNGIVLVKDWMGFWSKTDKYLLNKKTRTLQLVPQELYYVGIEARIKETFPIYKSREGSDIVANLKPGSKIFILVCDPSPQGLINFARWWYLIKSETGLVGWTRLGSDTIRGKVEGLPWAD